MISEIDLIPADYRNRQQLVRDLRIFAFANIVVVGISVLVFLVLNQMTDSIKRDLAKLQKEKAISAIQRETIARLGKEKQELDREWSVLTGLRGGTTVEDILIDIDQALVEGDVWFTSWEFFRAGKVSQNSESTADTGYFVIVNRESPQQRTETWKIDTHVKIKGQAMDHSTLSRFVRRLLKQKRVSDVKILNTALREYAAGRIVEFDLAVLVRNQLRRG